MSLTSIGIIFKIYLKLISILSTFLSYSFVRYLLTILIFLILVFYNLFSVIGIPDTNMLTFSQKTSVR